MKFKSLFFALLSLSFLALCNSCKDDNEDVGYNIQPQGDLLTTFSSGMGVSVKSLLVDSVLAKSSYLFLGQYTDSHFGPTQAEFMTQVDSRLDGVSLPDTNVVSSSAATYGILNTLMTALDSSFGKITAVKNPSDVVVDSAFFYIEYDNDFMGDSSAVQAISVYALNKTLPSNTKLFTNTKVKDYCNKDTLLGTVAYQVAGKRVIRVPLDLEYAKRMAACYLKNSKVRDQKQFNDLFKGFYVSHVFNEGAVIKVKIAGVLLYYHYDADIYTSFNGADTVVNSKNLKANPLVSSLFLSANKSVERVNLFNHPEISYMNNLVGDNNFSYVFTPAGMYTSVEIPYQQIKDSILVNCKDSSKVEFNSVLLKLYAKDLDWVSKLTKSPSSYMILINKDSIADFFYHDKRPDGLTSIAAVWNPSAGCYSFDLSVALQTRLTKNQDGTFDNLLNDMVVLPITISTSESVNYYYQQLWLTGARFYSQSSEFDSTKPRVDIVYTKRE